MLRALLLNTLPYSVVSHPPHDIPNPMRPHSTPRAGSSKGGRAHKRSWLSKWSQFHGEKTTNTTILCSIHLWWFQWSLKQLTGLSTTIHVEVSVQILDTPAKRKLSFRRKDNCSPRVKIQHKLYLNLKLNITSSIYRYPSYHAFFLFVFVFFLKFKALPLAFDIHS